MRSVLFAAAILALGLVAFRLALPWLVPRFVYQPASLAPSEGDPARWGHEGASALRLRAADGTRLHAWWFPARDRRCGVGLFLHGNAGHLAHRGPIAESLAHLGFDVLLPDYRGYGLSEGTPDEQGLYRDAEAAYEVALARSGLAPSRLLVMGNSLGAGVAVALAASRPIGALVLVSPFTSTVAVGRHAYRFLPARLLDWTAHRFDAESRLAEVEAPVLVVRGGRDRIVPEAEARAVHRAAREPKAWHEEPGAGHNDLLGFEGPWRAVRSFARTHLCPDPEPPDAPDRG